MVARSLGQAFDHLPFFVVFDLVWYVRILQMV